jgi:predicted ABC-type ATPase
MPWLWIVAGPNGSGKSTLVEAGVLRAVCQVELRVLNADVRTARIRQDNPDEPQANLRAAIEIDAEVVSCIERGIDFVVETVLSSDKYLDDVAQAITSGYRIGVIYVCLASPEYSVGRVALRHAQGGHDVPRERIVERWYRSIAMLGRLVPTADQLLVFDNSDEEPVLIAEKPSEYAPLRLLHPGRIPEIDAVLRANGAI